MKKSILHMIAATAIILSVGACHAGDSNRSERDTVVPRTTSDTVALPGTPGPSGTQPRPSDTTKAHRDSIKRTANSFDSSSSSVTP